MVVVVISSNSITDGRVDEWSSGCGIRRNIVGTMVVQ